MEEIEGEEELMSERGTERSIEGDCAGEEDVSAEGKEDEGKSSEVGMGKT